MTRYELDKIILGLRCPIMNARKLASIMLCLGVIKPHLIPVLLELTDPNTTKGHKIKFFVSINTWPPEQWKSVQGMISETKQSNGVREKRIEHAIDLVSEWIL
jgi:hypothetical protein